MTASAIDFCVAGTDFLNEFAQLVLCYTLKMDALKFVQCSQSGIVILLVAKFLNLVRQTEDFQDSLVEHGEHLRYSVLHASRFD